MVNPDSWACMMAGTSSQLTISIIIGKLNQIGLLSSVGWYDCWLDKLCLLMVAGLGGQLLIYNQSNFAVVQTDEWVFRLVKLFGVQIEFSLVSIWEVHVGYQVV